MTVYDFKDIIIIVYVFNQNYNDINFLTGKKLQITYDKEGDFAKNQGNRYNKFY